MPVKAGAINEHNVKIWYYVLLKSGLVRLYRGYRRWQPTTSSTDDNYTQQLSRLWSGSNVRAKQVCDVLAPTMGVDPHKK